MECPKCKFQNPEPAQFCLRCHTPLRYVCPSCQHVQMHGGTCGKCGIDFTKYLTMMQFQMETNEKQERERLKNRSAIFKQILLLPITGGFSLLKYFSARLRGE